MCARVIGAWGGWGGGLGDGREDVHLTQGTPNNPPAPFRLSAAASGLESGIGARKGSTRLFSISTANL